MSTEQNRTELIEFLGDLDGKEFITISYLQEKQIIAYGAGSGFFTFSSFITDKYNLEISLILDIKFGSNETFNGIRACSPFTFVPTDLEKNESIVVVTVGNEQIYKDIYELLKSTLGFRNIVWAFDIFEYSLHNTPIDYIDNIEWHLIQNIRNIIATYNIFHDELSKDIFRKIIGTYFLKKRITIPNQPIEEQYFPKDIKLKKGYDCFIDCGSFTGDTIKQMRKLSLKVDMLICFEPVLKHFIKLLYELELSEAKKTIAFPCGVYDTEKMLRFCDRNSNSYESGVGELFIQTVAIDHVIHGIKPTFIKMDIEGAEIKALGGARQTIIRNEPDLAISVYHLVNHVWEIPLYIASLGVNYKFFLRNNTSYITETVLYATKC